MTEIYLPRSVRDRHIYISGMTGTGKSTLIHNLMLSDIRQGFGCALIDAKGTLAPEIAQTIPDDHLKRTVYLDLDSPIPMDFMRCGNDHEEDSFVSDLVEIFNRFENGLGNRMDALLRYIVISLNRRGNASFVDIYRVLTDRQFRHALVDHPSVKQDEYLNNFWRADGHKLSEKIISSESGIGLAFSRMGRFILSRPLREILNHADAKLNFDDIIKQKKILLVQLKPKNDAAMLYGSLIVSKLQQAIFRRGKGPQFYLYVDEFQNFKSSGFEDSLSMARQFGLCLTLANQFMAQLQDDVQNAIVNNVATYFLFNMKHDNVARLKGVLKDPPPPPPRDTSAAERELEDWKEAVRFWKARLDDDDLYADDGSEDWNPHNEYAFNFAHLEHSKEQVRTGQSILNEMRRPEPQFHYIDILPELPVGTCVYRAADGTTQKINLPKAPSRLLGNHLTTIKESTLAQYGMNSTMLSPSCNTSEIPHTEKNGKDENIAPSGPAAVQVE